MVTAIVRIGVLQEIYLSPANTTERDIVMTNKMRQIHPGEILKGEIEELNMTSSSLAGRLAVPANRITGILRKTRGVTADTALRLSRFFGTTPEFWLNLQMTYDLRLAQDTKGEAILEKVKPVAA